MQSNLTKFNGWHSYIIWPDGTWPKVQGPKIFHSSCNGADPGTRPTSRTSWQTRPTNRYSWVKSGPVGQYFGRLSIKVFFLAFLWRVNWLSPCIDGQFSPPHMLMVFIYVYTASSLPACDGVYTASIESILRALVTLAITKKQKRLNPCVNIADTPELQSWGWQWTGRRIGPVDSWVRPWPFLAHQLNGLDLTLVSLRFHYKSGQGI